MTPAHEEDDPKLSYVLEYTTPHDQDIVYLARWWVVHPTRGLVVFMGEVPQCSDRQAMTVRLRDGLYPWANVRLIPLAYIPARMTPWGSR